MKEPLARPATGKNLLALFHAGLLPRETFERALGSLGIQRRWRHWSNLLLLCLGSALLLVGIVFFVAHNWMTLPKAAKLGGLQVLILACAVAAWRLGLHKLGGRALLFAACFLVGVFLAAFGQIYQTGADAYELFRGWALLIVVWVVASRAPAHWLLLLVVTDLAIILYWEQVRAYRWETNYAVWMLLALIQVLGLLGLELGRKHHYFWSDHVWPRWLLVPAILFQLCAPATLIIIDDKYARPWAWLVLVSLVAAIPGGYRYFRRVEKDLFCLTCTGAAAVWVMFLYPLRLLTDIHSNCFMFLFLGVLAILLLGGLVRWVRGVNIAMREEAGSHG